LNKIQPSKERITFLIHLVPRCLEGISLIKDSEDETNPKAVERRKTSFNETDNQIVLV
jgi:hypothetical protein